MKARAALEPADALAAADEFAQAGRRGEAKQTLAQALRAAAPKRKFFGKSTGAEQRRMLADRFAALSVSSPADGDVEVLTALVEEFPQVASLREARALALTNGGRHAEAVAEYEHLAAGRPDDGTALAKLATAYAALGRRDQSLERYHAAFDAHIRSKRLIEACEAARAIARLSGDCIDDVVRWVALAREVAPEDLSQALECLANAYHAREKMAQEAATWSDLLALEPDREDVRRRLAGAYTRILDEDPGDAHAWSGLEAADPKLAAELRVLLMASD